MAEIEITPTSLIVHIRGTDRFFAFKSQLEVPLEHIAGVEANIPEARDFWHGIRLVGTSDTRRNHRRLVHPARRMGVLGCA